LTTREVAASQIGFGYRRQQSEKSSVMAFTALLLRYREDNLSGLKSV
jgi:hypothetical protein